MFISFVSSDVCQYTILLHFQMSAAWVWIPTVFLSFLMLDVTASPSVSHMCDEPFQATITDVTNVTFPASRSFLDPDHVFYRELLRFTDEEIDREQEAAIQFFRNTYGLDFTNVEPDEQGQRILGNASFQPFVLPFNLTYVFNSWLVNGKTRTRCFRSRRGGFRVLFSGTAMLHGEYGGEEGRLAFANDAVFCGHEYFYDVCEQQGIVFQLESPKPIRNAPSDGWFIVNYRVHNRILGEGVLWGLFQMAAVNATTIRFESRQVITFL